MTMTNEEKIELAELLYHRMRSAFDIRRQRLIAAQTRLGWWQNGNCVPFGLAEIISAARLGTRPLTRDEFIVANIGMTPEEFAKSKRCIAESGGI